MNPFTLLTALGPIIVAIALAVGHNTTGYILGVVGVLVFIIMAVLAIITDNR